MKKSTLGICLLLFLVISSCRQNDGEFTPEISTSDLLLKKESSRKAQRSMDSDSLSTIQPTSTQSVDEDPKIPPMKID